MTTLSTANIMKDEIIQGEECGVFESTSKKPSTPPLLTITQTEVSGILLDASRTLSPEETSRAKDQAREFQERVELFIQEVERVRGGFKYRYNGENYINRLSMGDSVVMEVFERILADNKKLKKQYKLILEIFNGDKERLQKKILKDCGMDLIFEGMKEGEYTWNSVARHRFTGINSANDTKEKIIEIARNGRRIINLAGSGLDGVFVGEPELFKEMVVEFARSGGKGLDLSVNALDEVFRGEPELFKEMMVEFARNGGRWINLGYNSLEHIFTSKPVLFKEMVVEFARSGGKGLELKNNGLDKIFVGKPELFKDMVVEFLKSGGKNLDIRNNSLKTILDYFLETKPFRVLFQKKFTIGDIIDEACKIYQGEVNSLSWDNP